MVQKKMHENRNSFTKSKPLCGPVSVQAVFFCPPLSSQRVSVYACRENPDFFPKRLISMIISHSVFSEENPLCNPHNYPAFNENVSRTKRNQKKSSSMLQLLSFILLSFSLILGSSAAPGESWYSGSKAGMLLEG